MKHLEKYFKSDGDYDQDPKEWEDDYNPDDVDDYDYDCFPEPF